MLSLLHIENIAVIEQADITFEDSLNVLTGETGVGKSIIIYALGSLLGARSSRDLIRSGCPKALVSAVFYNPPSAVKAMLSEIGVEPEDELLISREMSADGRNVCKVGGKPATVAQLRELGQHLIQIHGQHDTQSLLDDEKHLGLLDSYAETDLGAYLERLQEQKAIEREINGLRISEEEKERQIDRLSYRVSEVEKAELVPGEEAELTEQRKRMKFAQRITDALNEAYTALFGTEDESGASALLDTAADALSDGARYAENLGELAARLESLRIETADAAEELRDLRDEFEESPWDADYIESRLDLLHRLKNKLGFSPDELIDQCELWRQELDNIQFASQRLETLEKKREQAAEKTRKEAEKITKHRTQSARKLEKAIVSELADLDMQRVRFQIEINPAEPGQTGADEIRFLLAANVGEPLKPLSSTASGGELSRIMLALKNVLASAREDGISLIFDEVDTGISGRAAQRVAEKLRAVSRRKQVLCVTHLPQIAAMADNHFRIAKGVSGERTVTTVNRLEYAQRVEELARITGGSQITPALLESAAELIAQAQG